MRNVFMWFKIFFLYPLFFFSFILAFALLVTHFVTRPSNVRDWIEEQKILPYAETKGNLITVHNIRNFTYSSTASSTPGYYDRVFNIDRIKGISYVVEPFSGFPGAAHTFVSFEFEGEQFVSISIEARREKGEEFSSWKGLFNQSELMYVIADERDVIKLRSNYRHDKVYVYPVKADKEKVKELFLDMIARTNTLKDTPEFYNTVTNNCTNNIVAHVNLITPKRIPLFNLQILFPANSDKLAYSSGLIDTDLSFEEARKRFYINDRAEKYANDPRFSVKIRGEE